MTHFVNNMSINMFIMGGSVDWVFVVAVVMVAFLEWCRLQDMWVVDLVVAVTDFAVAFFVVGFDVNLQIYLMKKSIKVLKSLIHSV
jgi:hypothetical protein